MKRRKFIQNLGLGAAPLVLQSNFVIHQKENFPVYDYPQPTRIKEAVSQDGKIMLRLEFTSAGNIDQTLKSKINCINGNIERSKSYFFEKGEDKFISDSMQTSFLQASSDTDVLVLWLNVFSEETKIEISRTDGGKGKDFSFLLKDLLENLEVKGTIGKTSLSANFLLDREIGEIDPADMGINVAGNDFVFVIMADPQGADTSDNDPKRMRSKIHNAFVEESIRLANNLKVKPAFCMMLGDIVDYQGEARDFATMAKFFEKLEMPALYEMGNHESKYRTTFNPGYNFSGFNNYFAAQKALNGSNKLLYSFNLGKWHFIVWPDPLRKTFWENHPHYFDWLERDLEKYKNKPTIFMQHIPLHPIGINPLINYAESVTVKRMLLNILAKHGNVKVIYSGHVHIPVKSSFKTAVSYKGIQCINLPAAGYRPRSFGEPDYSGGPSQGIAIIDIKGEQVQTTYKTVTFEEYTYPQQLPEFQASNFPLWLKYKWELPAEKQFRNGSFAKGLKNWGRRFVFEEDVHPSNICEVLTEPSSNVSALYLKSTRRGFCTPGQDRLPQDINRIFQAVKLEPSKTPTIELEYFLDKENCDFNGWNGAYIWVEGFRGSNHALNLIYFANKAMVNVGGTYGKSFRAKPTIFGLNNTPGKWHKMQINVKHDFERTTHKINFEETRIDRLVLNLGTWNVNDGELQPFACYFNNFELKYGSNSASNINGQAVLLASDNNKWWRGKYQPSTNIAGEHHYFTEGLNHLKY